ncbi:hypothetical protein [Streptomyces sp. NPDC058745]|uniref:hypothetical protein n=1 Tax=Streptomyces sp. NPDC058745 TaxID=3346621 RepID=UPI00368E7674
MKVSYNQAELATVQEAASRENQALAAWVARAALEVAAESIVPVSVDAREVLQELIRSRGQLQRVVSSLDQVVSSRANPDEDETDLDLRTILSAVQAAVQRVDQATLQVMRERRPRS